MIHTGNPTPKENLNKPSSFTCFELTLKSLILATTQQGNQVHIFSLGIFSALVSLPAISLGKTHLQCELRWQWLPRLLFRDLKAALARDSDCSLGHEDLEEKA